MAAAAISSTLGQVKVFPAGISLFFCQDNHIMWTDGVVKVPCTLFHRPSPPTFAYFLHALAAAGVFMILSAEVHVWKKDRWTVYQWLIFIVSMVFRHRHLSQMTSVKGELLMCVNILDYNVNILWEHLFHKFFENVQNLSGKTALPCNQCK